MLGSGGFRGSWRDGHLKDSGTDAGLGHTEEKFWDLRAVQSLWKELSGYSLVDADAISGMVSQHRPKVCKMVTNAGLGLPYPVAIPVYPQLTSPRVESQGEDFSFLSPCIHPWGQGPVGRAGNGLFFQGCVHCWEVPSEYSVPGPDGPYFR